MKAISIGGISKFFGNASTRVTALDNVSVDIEENEFFTLLGPSGCGKTTLLRLIAGFESPDHGQIALYGEPIAHLPPYQRPVNTVFQSYALFPHMSVQQNIAFGLEMLGQSRAEIVQTTDQMLQLVQMQDLADRRTSQISGGQQQRVALARALAPHPKVLLLDEPLSALDFKLRKEMQLELKRLQAETGITFVFVTHDQEEALTMSDRIAVMSNGVIRQIGTPPQIYDHPAERFVADFIGESNFLNAQVIEQNAGGTRLVVAKSTAINISLDSQLTTASVTLMIRPEHAVVERPSHTEAAPTEHSVRLNGTLLEILYSGTDTRFHVTLDGGETFVTRRQNRPTPHLEPQPGQKQEQHYPTLQRGERITVQFSTTAIQVLND